MGIVVWVSLNWAFSQFIEAILWLFVLLFIYFFFDTINFEKYQGSKSEVSSIQRGWNFLRWALRAILELYRLMQPETGQTLSFLKAFFFLMEVGASTKEADPSPSL